MKEECLKFAADIADYARGAQQYIKDFDALFNHLRACEECRAKLFGLQQVFTEVWLNNPSPEFVKRMEEIKALARQGPPPAQPLSQRQQQLKDAIKLYKDKKYPQAKALMEHIVHTMAADMHLTKEDREFKSDCWYHLGLVCEALNNTDDAVSSFSKALELAPDDADGYYHRARLYWQRNQSQSALTDYAAAIELNPDYTEAYQERALVYFGLQKYQEAINDFTEAIDLVPDDTQNMLMRAIASTMLGKLNDALYDYNRMLKIDDKNYAAYINRGVVYAKGGKLEEAIADFKQALEIIPGDIDAGEYLLKAERELMAQEMEQKLKDTEHEIAQRYKKQSGKLKDQYEAEIQQLRQEIEVLKRTQEALIEIIRPRPEYQPLSGILPKTPFITPLGPAIPLEQIRIPPKPPTGRPCGPEDGKK